MSDTMKSGGMKSMHVVVWEYDVHVGAEAAFEALYGPGGDWIGLFSAYSGYLGTELLRDERPNYYITIDRWASAAQYAAFRLSAQDAYAAIDARGDRLVLSERRIGSFDVVE
jgi:heme-degrading monooxygenase HmoA